MGKQQSKDEFDFSDIVEPKEEFDFSDIVGEKKKPTGLTPSGKDSAVDAKPSGKRLEAERLLGGDQYDENGISTKDEVGKINNILDANKGKNFVKRIIEPAKYPTLPLGDDHATHLMAWGTDKEGNHRVFPTVIQDEKTGKLKQLNIDGAWEHALKTGESIKFDDPKEADWFSQHYKKVWENNAPEPIGNEDLHIATPPSDQRGKATQKFEVPTTTDNTSVTPNLKTPALAQKAQEKEDYKKSIDNGISRPMDAISRVNQQFYGLPGDVLKTLGIAGAALKRGVTGEGKPEDDILYKAGEKYKQFIKDIAPDNPAYQEELQAQVGTAIGDLASLYATGGVGRLGKAGGIVAESTVLKNLAKVSPEAATGAVQTGISEYQTAKDSGASDDQAFGAFLKNAAAGSVLERIPVQHFFKRLDDISDGGLKNILNRGFTGGTEEAATEVVQQMFSNADAANTYNKTRQLLDGVGGAGGIGFGLGFVVSALGGRLRKMKEEAKTPEEKSKIQESLDLVNQKANETTQPTEGESKQPTSIQPNPGTVIDHAAGVSQPKMTDAYKALTEKRQAQMDDLQKDISPEAKEIIAKEAAATDEQIKTIEAAADHLDQLTAEKANLEQSLTHPLSDESKQAIMAKIDEISIEIDSSVPQGLKENSTPPVDHKAGEPTSPESSTSVEDPALLENPPTESTEEGNKQRKFVKRVDESENVAPKRTPLSEDAKNYIQKKLTLTDKEAQEYIDTVGPEQAISDVNSKSLPHDVRIAVGIKTMQHYEGLMNQAIKDGNEDLADTYNKLANDAEEATAKVGTILGQAVNAFKLFPSKERTVYTARKARRKQIDEQIEIDRPRVERIKEEFDQADQDAAEEIARTVKVKKPESIDAIKTAKAKAKKDLDDLFKLLNNSANTGIDPIVAGKIIAKGTEYGYYVIREGVHDFVEWKKRMNAQLGAGIEPYLDEIWDSKHKGLKISETAQEVKKAKAFTDVSKLINKNLDEKMAAIVKKHLTEVGRTKEKLTAKIIEGLNVSEAEAKDLAELIHKEFDKKASEKKKQILNRYKSAKEKIAPKKEAKQAYERLIELSNLGALTDEEFHNIYQSKAGLNALSPAEAKKIGDLAERVQTAKEGLEKSSAVQDLLRYQESIGGIDWSEVSMGVWYANVLSGVSTQTTNVYANFMNSFGEIYAASVTDPKRTGDFFKMWFQGMGEGRLEAMATLKTGYTPVKTAKNIESPNVLERVKFKGKYNPANSLKYVKRLMDAADVFAYHGLKEFRAYQEAVIQAKKEGKSLPSDVIRQKALEKIFKTKEHKADAIRQAEAEGAKGKEVQRRANEILDLKRDGSIKIKSSQLALKGTFNDKPTGVLGLLATSIGQATEKVKIGGVKPLKFIVPFTQVVANVANTAIDYTPQGFLRAKEISDPQQRAEEYVKAITGTLAAVALFALTDDEDGIFEITANGTGDTQRNYELQERGWQAHSIKIGDKWYSYKNTPLAIPFATIGFMRDAQKYQGDKDLKGMAGYAMWGGFKFFTELSFLQNLSEFFNSFSSDNPQGAATYFDKINSFAAKNAKSFVVPNLVTQTSKTIQELNNVSIKQSANPWSNIYRDIPIARNGLNDMVNALGEPVYPSQVNKFIPLNPKSGDAEPVWKYLDRNNIFVGRISQRQLENIVKTTVTPEQYYRFSKIRGAAIKELLEKRINIIRRNGGVKKEVPEKEKTYLLKVKRIATIKAAREVFK